MFKRIPNTVAFIAIAILAGAFAACDNGSLNNPERWKTPGSSSGGGGNAAPENPGGGGTGSATYSGTTTEGETYTLAITENPSARYAAQEGDKYELTVTPGAKKKRRHG
jgi:hypothetical protein